MARAEIKLPSGAVALIEGTPEEVNRILAVYSEPSAGKGRPAAKAPVQETTARSSAGPMALIRELKTEGFFDSKRTLGSVVDSLAEGGNIYSDASVGKALQRLVQSKELGRIREEGVWKYVKR